MQVGPVPFVGAAISLNFHAQLFLSTMTLQPWRGRRQIRYMTNLKAAGQASEKLISWSKLMLLRRVGEHDDAAAVALRQPMQCRPTLNLQETFQS